MALQYFQCWTPVQVLVSVYHLASANCYRVYAEPVASYLAMCLCAFLHVMHAIALVSAMFHVQMPMLQAIATADTGEEPDTANGDGVPAAQ